MLLWIRSCSLVVHGFVCVCVLGSYRKCVKMHSLFCYHCLFLHGTDISFTPLPLKRKSAVDCIAASHRIVSHRMAMSSVFAQGLHCTCIHMYLRLHSLGRSLQLSIYALCLVYSVFATRTYVCCQNVTTIIDRSVCDYVAVYLWF